MKKLIAFCMLITLVLSCQKVPLTGRSQLSLLPASQMQQMSYQSYKQFLDTSQVVSSNSQNTAMVRKVGNRIKDAVELYMRQNNLSSRLEGYKWEFNLVESKEVNAWCMPGGKVVVYTGILPITQSETGLAVVLGHEISHAIANHGDERMSQGLVQQLGGTALQVALANKPAATQALFVNAFGVGSQVAVMLPFSRLQESEADKLGLIFMAMAGYDPNEAVTFWQRMSAKGGSKQPEFLSTHPSDETRIRNLQKAIPDAQKYYNKSKS